MATRRHFGSVRRRGAVWEASYWHNGRRHVGPTRFLSKSDALAYLSSVEVDIRRGVWVDPMAGRMTVRELAAMWQTSNPAKRETTGARDEIAVRLHILPVLGERRIDQLTPRDVQLLVNEWALKHRPRTVKRNFEVVRAMLSYAVANDWLHRNPCRIVKLPQLPAGRRYDLTPADVARIADQVEACYRPMVWIGAVLGLRWSEVAGLRAGRIDLARAMLMVSEGVTRGHGGRLVLGPPKSKAGNRTMALPDALVQMLERHLEAMGGVNVQPDAFVFTDHGGGPVRYENWRRRIWIPAVDAAGCSGAGFHDLRRLAATSLVLEGVDVKTAQVRLGHADPRMTLSVYASAPRTADQDAAERLNRRFFSPSPAPTSVRDIG